MIIKSLTLVNYKNFSSKTFSFDEKINSIVGNNGVGKTNVLDAIYHLSYTKGYFNPVSSQNIRYGTDFFMLEGEFYRKGRTETVVCSLKKGQKKLVKRNDKEYERLANHYGLFPVVIISPADTDLIREGSDIRRKFIDTIISSYDKNYLNALIAYTKTLSQRNALLKYFAANHVFDATNLDIYDRQLDEMGMLIYSKRKEFLDDFIPVFEHRYKELAGSVDERISLTYKTQLNESAKLYDLLKEHIQRDRLLQYTGVGVHKDDIVLGLNGYPIKKNGSQGQQKSFLIAMRLAQYDFMKTHTGVNPILLLDDIFDKLDENRVGQLIKQVSNAYFGQIFITDTHPERTEQILKQVDIPHQIFKLE